MRKFITLCIFLIIGFFAGYYIINNFIVSINYTQYLFIELVITAFHLLYNISKKELYKTNTE